MKPIKLKLLSVIILFFLIHNANVFASEDKPSFDTSNDALMQTTIIGAIASFSFACYQGKAPCSLSPNVDTDKLTFSVDVGADNTIQHTRLALGADWLENIYDSKNLNISGRMEINTNFWSSTLDNPQNKNGFIIGIHPIFRYSSPHTLKQAYFELGAGPQIISDTILENENKSTLFQFGNVLGLGYANKNYEIGYRYLHYSNANIKMPNPGTDFHNLHLAYKF